MALALTAQWADAIGSIAAAIATTVAVVIALAEIVRTSRPRLLLRSGRVTLLPADREQIAIEVCASNDGYVPVKLFHVALIARENRRISIGTVPFRAGLMDHVTLQPGESASWFFTSRPVEGLSADRVNDSIDVSQKYLACTATDMFGRAYSGRGPDRTCVPRGVVTSLASSRARRLEKARMATLT